MLKTNRRCTLYSSVELRGRMLPYQLRVHPEAKATLARLLRENAGLTPGLMQQIGKHALSRGVSVINIVEGAGPLKFTRVTCRSMTIPIKLLEYALKHKIPIAALEQPDPPICVDLQSGITGDGVVLVFAGAIIGYGVSFQTASDKPIVLGEMSTVEGQQVIPAGTVLGKGESKIVR